jgi:hypothetical protein
MTTQQSFTKFEKKYRTRIREQMDQAESTQDVRRFFFQIVRDMLREIPGCEVDLVYEAVRLTPNEAPGFAFKPELLGEGGFERLQALMADSDLERILRDFAETCIHRLRRLDKNPEKTEAKTWPVPGPADKRHQQ